MYICRRAEVDLIDMDLDGDAPKALNDQWWRIHYAPLGSSPVSVASAFNAKQKQKTTEEKVLEAAKNESNNTILVYASEKALNFQKHALPKALDVCFPHHATFRNKTNVYQNFVRWDNAAFRAELPDSQSGTDTQSPIQADDSQSVTSSGIGPSSPGKRKYGEEDSGSRVNARRVNVTERELRGSDETSSIDSAGTVTREMSSMLTGGETEMIIGVDPGLLDGEEEMKSGKEMEMQERSGIPMLATRSIRGSSVMGTSTIDSMDLDQVLQDENVREESAAVKRVGFVE